MARSGIVVLLVAVSSLAGCGDDASGGSPAGTGSNNVRFAATCAPHEPCGGDPTGRWRLADACVGYPAEGFECASGASTAHGTSTGTLTLSFSGFDLDVDTELRQCGWVDGSADGASGSVMIMGSTIVLGVRAQEFCVDGDSLWLHDSAAIYPDLVVVHYVRDTRAMP